MINLHDIIFKELSVSNLLNIGFNDLSLPLPQRHVEG